MDSVKCEVPNCGTQVMDKRYNRCKPCYDLTIEQIHRLRGHGLTWERVAHKCGLKSRATAYIMARTIARPGPHQQWQDAETPPPAQEAGQNG